MPKITTGVMVYLTPEQITGLEDAAKAKGVSRAELVRQIVDRYLKGTAK